MGVTESEHSIPFVYFRSKIREYEVALTPLRLILLALPLILNLECMKQGAGTNVMSQGDMNMLFTTRPDKRIIWFEFRSG